MASSDSKLTTIQRISALASVAGSLNNASDELTKSVGVVDDALKRFNLGLVVWVMVSRWADDFRHGEDQIGYCKLNGKWGLALRTSWEDNNAFGGEPEEDAWHFNDAPREMRLKYVDRIPEVLEELTKKASEVTRRIQEKAKEARELAEAIRPVSNDTKPATTDQASSMNLALDTVARDFNKGAK